MCLFETSVKWFAGPCCYQADQNCGGNGFDGMIHKINMALSSSFSFVTTFSLIFHKYFDFITPFSCCLLLSKESCRFLKAMLDLS